MRYVLICKLAQIGSYSWSVISDYCNDLEFWKMVCEVKFTQVSSQGADNCGYLPLGLF